MSGKIVIHGGGGFGTIDLTPRTYHGEIKIEGNTQRPPVYDGPYEFTPTADEQTVRIAHMQVTQNITINPIPSNYGLVTYNGSVITIS